MHQIFEGTRVKLERAHYENRIQANFIWSLADTRFELLTCAYNRTHTHPLHDNGNFGVLFLEYVHCSVSNVIGWLIWTFWSNALQFHIQQTTWHVLALVEVLFLEHLISAPITISLKKA